MSTTLSNLNVSSQFSADVANGLLSGSFVNRSAATPSVGTAAGSIDRLVHQTFTVTAGTPLSIDLTSVADVAGNTVSFGHLCYSKFVNTGTNTAGELNIWGGTNGVFATDDKPVAANNGEAIYQNLNPGKAIDSTHKIVTIAAAVGTVTGSITLAGRSV